MLQISFRASDVDFEENLSEILGSWRMEDLATVRFKLKQRRNASDRSEIHKVNFGAWYTKSFVYYDQIEV